MLCYVMFCYVMLCYVMLCYVMHACMHACMYIYTHHTHTHIYIYIRIRTYTRPYQSCLTTIQPLRFCFLILPDGRRGTGFTNSVGPPLLAPMVGVPQAMHSMKTMPKGSWHRWKHAESGAICNGEMGLRWIRSGLDLEKILFKLVN